MGLARLRTDGRPAWEPDESLKVQPKEQRMRVQVRKAFTLVEILIVVVILGILAAIVVPQFTNATQDAQQGNIQTQLETINNQIELYRARSGATNADLMAHFTTAGDPWQMFITDGYLKAPPRNPRINDREEQWVVVAGAPDPATGSGGGSANAGWHVWLDEVAPDVFIFRFGASYFNEELGTLEPETP
jgi:general secretion pathway protein G